MYPLWTGETSGIARYFAKTAGGTFIPYNLALLAAIAEKTGHEAKIIDGELEKISLNEIVKRSKEYDPDIIVLTGMTPFYNVAIECATLLKTNNTNAAICIGGQHLTIMGEKAFHKCFDYAYTGECENQLVPLLDCIENNKPFDNIKGLYYRNGGDEVMFTGPNTYIRDLDSLPFPSRDLLPQYKYKLGTLKGRKNFTSILTMRGCPWHCIFCASDKLNTTLVSKRSPENVIEEIKHQNK